jgi:peptidylamidoglycolate lyase
LQLQYHSLDKELEESSVALDNRGKEPLLICTARIRNEFHWYNLNGKYVKSVYLPGAYMSRPVIDGENIYSGICFGTYQNDFRMWVKRGFVIILDKDNKVVSCPGGIAPEYSEKGELKHIYQDQPIFDNCHDGCKPILGNYLNNHISLLINRL